LQLVTNTDEPAPELVVLYPLPSPGFFERADLWKVGRDGFPICELLIAKAEDGLQWVAKYASRQMSRQCRSCSGANWSWPITVAANAGWDLEMLKLELTDLKSLGADLASLGFDSKELAAVFNQGSPGLVDENEVPELQEIAVSAPGEIWCLGPHRLACGDATEPAVVSALLAGCVPQLMVTDPPYGVEYDPEWRHRIGVNKSDKRGKIQNDDQADWREAWALFPGEIAYIWHGALHATTVAESLVKSGFTIRSQIIWAKERLVMSRGDYHWRHEPCWYAVRKKGNWTGDRKQTTLWEIPSGGQDAETKHATQKPVECMRRPMLNNSSPGQAVYEPFSGSGSTLIAAQSCGRVFHGVEIDPIYVDVAIRRWEAFTGEQAIRQGDGKSFAELVVQSGAKAANAGSEAVS